MLRKSNAAILEIGASDAEPRWRILKALTLEAGDIEDLKECVAGECQVKLSAPMIERFRKEIDWAAPDYQTQSHQSLQADAGRVHQRLPRAR